MYRSFITCFIILLLCAIIETAILSNILFLPAIPDFLLICVLYISLQNGKTSGEISGFTAGLLLDFVTGAPLGFNCLLRTLIGYIAGINNTIINIDGYLIPALLGFFATIVKALITTFILFLFPNIVSSYKIISQSFLFELLFNTILTPFMFKFLNLFTYLKIEYKGEKN